MMEAVFSLDEAHTGKIGIQAYEANSPAPKPDNVIIDVAFFEKKHSLFGRVQHHFPVHFPHSCRPCSPAFRIELPGSLESRGHSWL